MDARVFECRRCGYTGPPEDVIRGFSVCPECGTLAPSHAPVAPDATPAPFDRPIYRYRARLHGPLARLLQRMRTPAIRDAADRVVAQVQTRPSMGRFVALGAGAAVFTGAVVALLALLAMLPDERWIQRLVLYATVPALLVGCLALVAWLSPAPDRIVVGAGGDPRLLMHVRPVDAAGGASVLEVEDAEGVTLGTLRLHRVRELIFPLGSRRPLIEIAPARGPALVVRRPSAFLPGWVFETADGEAVGSYGTNPGLLARDQLEIAEPPACDRRLFVAAILVARP
ncbi:MAG TPA: hypothetical protein RMH99_08080 [Sandaracinaceae bacterium LLY-WYZ-13_1]|nr:hypothetical protein [Sandaracinaceae bacterium LLY-WYZ-13_1]